MVEVNLLVQTAYIGDLLLSIPLILRLRAIDPERKLILLCRQGLGSLYLLTGLVDEVIEVNKKDKVSWKTAKEQLRKYRYKLVVCPHQSFTSARLVFGLKAKHTIGYYKFWNFWAFKERVRRPVKFPEAIRQLYLLQHFDPWVGEHLESYEKTFSYDKAFLLSQKSQPQDSQWVPDWASMSLKYYFTDPLNHWSYRVSGAEKSEGEDKIKTALSHLKQLKDKHQIQNSYFCLAPGSVWGTKRWTIEGYGGLGNFLTKQKFQVVILGAPDEKEICEQVQKIIGDCVNLAGETSLFESALLLKEAKALITNDCGAMHLGAMVETPTVALFGPTTLNLGYRPWQNNAVVLQNMDLKCRPCGKHGPQNCPIKTHICMKSISVNEVVQSLTKLLSI